MKKLYTTVIMIIACGNCFALPMSRAGNFGNSIFSFIENDGQVTDQYQHVRNDIQFKLAASGGLNIFIGNGFIHYQFSKADHGVSTDPLHIDRVKPEKQSFTMYRMDVELVGANTHATVLKEERQDYYENYYTAWSGSNGMQAHSFGKVTYKDIYPNIDWVLYSGNGQLKHEFVVRAGGKVSDIQLKYSGTTDLSLNNEGGIVATTPQGTITEDAPKSYTANGKIVNSSYVLNGNTISYTTASFEGSLTIDPGIEWATYFASGTTSMRALVTDAQNNVLMGGYTSASNIATAGAHQVTYGGLTDGFLAKFKPNGTPDWITYYGGTDEDDIAAMVIDGSGNIYVGGNTSSATGISTIGPALSGPGDGFLAKFNAAGVRSWGMYIGGTSLDYVTALAINTSGNIYVGGMSNSTNAIATAGTHQTVKAGLYDSYLAVYDANGAKLVGTYYGGVTDESTVSVIADPSGDAILVGYTNSSGGISSIGSYQPAAGGLRDGFVARFNASGIRQWGTFYGGTGNDYLLGAVADNSGIYITGYTGSTAGIATSGSYQPVYGGGTNDAMIVKFNNSGTPLWATYYGSTDFDIGRGIAVDGSGNIILAGYTSSTTGMTTPDAYQSVYAGNTDGFLAVFNAAGMRQWGSYFGGSSFDYAYRAAADGIGNMYFAGETYSTGGIATPGAYDATFTGAQDGFLAKFCNAPVAGTQPVDAAAVEGNNVQFNITATGGAVTYQWQTDIGMGYQNATNAGQYSGVTTNTLTVSNVTTANNNQKVRCLISSGSCMDTTTEAKIQVIPAGIKTIDAVQFSIMPNPVKDDLVIQSKLVIEKAEVFSLTGQRVLVQTGHDNQVHIDMRTVVPGVYMVRVNGVYIGRVVKE